jgi:hypothetical protein
MVAARTTTTRVALAALVLTSSACTLVLDRDRHRGTELEADDAASPDRDAGPPGLADARGLGDSGLDAASACDVDRDGHESLACGGDDCDDTDSRVHPLAPPICGNGRLESCASSPELLELLDAAEVGVLPRVVLGRDVTVAPEVAVSVAVSPTSQAGVALVAYRVRRAEIYSLEVALIDLSSGTVSSWPTSADGLFARAVGGGDLGATGDLAQVAGVVTSPDTETLRGTWVSASADGSGASASVSFEPEARRGVALVGLGGAPTALAFAADDRLVRYSLRDASVVEFDGLGSAFASPRVRGEGAGPFAHFLGNESLVWDLSEKACVSSSDCASGTCGGDGLCTPGAPQRVLVPHASGWLDLAYDAGLLWYTHDDPAHPGVVEVGTLGCNGLECIGSPRGSLVLGPRIAQRPNVEPLGADALGVAAIVDAATGTASAARVGFHRLSDGRQVPPYDLDLFEVGGYVEELVSARSVIVDPRAGRIVQLVLATVQPSTSEPLVVGGLRACETP